MSPSIIQSRFLNLFNYLKKMIFYVFYLSYPPPGSLIILMDFSGWAIKALLILKKWKKNIFRRGYSRAVAYSVYGNYKSTLQTTRSSPVFLSALTHCNPLRDKSRQRSVNDSLSLAGRRLDITDSSPVCSVPPGTHEILGFL